MTGDSEGEAYMRRELIVAKGEEEVPWLRGVPSDWKVSVYSRAKRETNKSFVMKGKNIPHSYLTYLTSRYDDLPNQMVFVQGDPFKACPDLLETLERVEADLDFGGLSDDVVLYEGSGSPYFLEEFSTSGRSFSRFFEELFGYRPPPLLCCALHSQFVVHRDRVLSRKREFYQKALAFSSISGNESFFEYVWHQIFRGDDSLSLDLPAELREDLKVILVSLKVARGLRDKEYVNQLLNAANQRIRRHFQVYA